MRLFIICSISFCLFEIDACIGSCERDFTYSTTFELHNQTAFPCQHIDVIICIYPHRYLTFSISPQVTVNQNYTPYNCRFNQVGLHVVGWLTPTLTLIYIITLPHSPNMYPGMQLSRRPYTSEDTWRGPLRYRAKVSLGFRVSHADNNLTLSRAHSIPSIERAMHACD